MLSKTLSPKCLPLCKKKSPKCEALVPYQVAFPSLKKPPFILDESMPIYSPTGFLDITNATLRTSNLEAQNFRLNGGNIYVTSELTTDELLNLDNVVNAGNTTSNTVQFTNTNTGLVVDSNIVVAGNVTAGSFLGDGSGLTSIPPSAITGTLSQWSDGTNSDVYIASNVGIGNVHTLTSNTLQVGANLYVRDADANVLTVTGNVAADYFEGDGSKLTGISSNLEQIANNGNVTSNTVQFTNATTGFVTTSNIEVGGALKINTITAAAYHALSAVTAVGASTGDTIQLTNATTGLVTTANVDVGGDMNVTGNLTVLGTKTIVDTDTLRVKDPIIELGKDNPGTGDLGLVMTRPSGSSNVAMIFDESTDTLEIGYTQSNASDTDITMDSTPLSVNVNGDLSVTSNLEVGTANLFVDTVNSRVGIGTTSPDYLLDVQSTSDAADKTMARLYSSANATGVSSTGLIFEKGTGYGGAIKGFISQGVGSGLSLHTLNGGTDAQAMTIMNSGNVGIGTTSPSKMLHAKGEVVVGTDADNYTTQKGSLYFVRGVGRSNNGFGDRHHYISTRTEGNKGNGNNMTFHIDDGTTTNGTSHTSPLKLMGDGSVQLVGWKTKSWSGNTSNNGNRDVDVVTHSGLDSGVGIIAGIIEVIISRGGYGQQRAYARFHVNYSYWNSAFQGSFNVLEKNLQTGVTDITLIISNNPAKIQVRITSPSVSTGQYYIKFDGPIYNPA